MDALPMVITIVAMATAFAIGVFVFLLFPTRKPAPEPVVDVEEEGQAIANVVRPRAGLSGSLAAAAPKGYIGWIEKQIVLAGRPSGWSVTGVITWKLILAVVAALFGLLFVS